MSEKESDLNATLIRPRLKCYDLASGIFGAAGRYFILWDIVDPRTESNPNPNPNLNLILNLILTLILPADSLYPIR